jgi:hypothetical protein
MQSIKKSWKAICRRSINLWKYLALKLSEFKQGSKRFFKTDVVQFALIGLTIIVCIPLLIYLTHYFLNLMIDNDNFKNNITTKGQLGDSFGILNSAISIATCIALVISLRLQRKQIRLQQDQINEDRIIRNAEKLIEKCDSILLSTAKNQYNNQNLKFHGNSTEFTNSIRTSLYDLIGSPLNNSNSETLIDNFGHIFLSISALDNYLKSVSRLTIVIENMIDIYAIDQENKRKTIKIITNLLDSNTGLISLLICKAYNAYSLGYPTLYERFNDNHVNDFNRIAFYCETIKLFYEKAQDDINIYK